MKPLLLLSTALFSLLIFANAQNSSPYWSLAGNSNVSSSSKFGTTNNYSVRFYTNNKQRMIINSPAGLVGIGTASPTDQLHVNSPSGTNPFRAQVNGSTKLIVNSNGGVSVGSSSTPPSNGLYVSGNVGIGTSSPSYKLHVIGDAAITNGISVQDYGVVSNNSTGSYGVSTTGSFAGTYSSGDSYGVFASGTSSSATSIGVYGSAQTYGVYGLGTAYGVYGTGKQAVYASSTVANGDGVRSAVSGTTNYAINAYSANSLGVYASTGNSNSYAGYFSGNVYCSGTYSGSDIKLKKNIIGFDNAMNIISQLQPKNYEYRDDGNYAKMNLPQGTHYGFIAQDLEKVLPNLVKQTQFNVAKATPLPEVLPIAPQLNGANAKTEAVQPIKEEKAETIDFKAVNYTELIPIMVKAMQEQQTLIQDLKAKNENFQNQINDLKSLISKNNSSSPASLAGYLKQNIPNPSSNNTIISYYTPDNTKNAQIVVTDMKGSVLKTYSVSKGEGQVSISNGEFPAGTYIYTMYINSNKIDAKKMVIVR